MIEAARGMKGIVDDLALQYTGTYARERFFRFQAIGIASASEEALAW